MEKQELFIVFIVFGGVAVISSVIAQLIFFCEIEPTLRRLGHKIDFLSLKKYKNGWQTISEYKQSRIAENKPLTLWNVFCVCQWLPIICMVVWVMAVSSSK